MGNEHLRPGAVTTRSAREFAVSRRDFLTLLGLSGSTASAGALEACGPSIPVPDLRTDVLRAEDLVALRFEFANFVLEARDDGGSQLVRRGSDDGWIFVTFAPQHLLEEAFLENPLGAPHKPVDARIAGASRVVFRVGEGFGPIEFSSRGLLDAIRRARMNVARHAAAPEFESGLSIEPRLPGSVTPGTGVRGARLRQSQQVFARSSGADVSTLANTEARPIAVFPSTARVTSPGVTGGGLFDMGPGAPQEPTASETALELPFRLTISPNSEGQWAHLAAVEEALKGGRHELWHTRLGVTGGAAGLADESETRASLRTIRALWTRDAAFVRDRPGSYSTASPDEPFRASLTAADRIRIVQQSSNWDLHHEVTGRKVKPEVIAVDRLMLSALGGWLDVRGNFGENPALGLVGWEHRAAQGRDDYVKVVEAGYLYPWRHRAVKVTVTERKFRNPPDPRTAYLWKRTFVVVREPIAVYPASWRKLPFELVHVRSLVTPDLYGALDGSDPIKLETGPGQAHLFEMEAMDREGATVRFRAPAVWVPQRAAATTSDGASVRATAASQFASYGTARRSDLSGQRLSYAPARRPDDTTYETAVLAFDASNRGAVGYFPSTGLPFLPGVESATLSVEAIRGLLGQDLPTPFRYHAAYLEHGFTDASGPNAGELLLQVVGAAIDLNFARKSENSGGFVAPSMDITGLSRMTGPVAGNLAATANKIAQGQFDPAEFFAKIDAKIFGVFELKDVIAAAGGLGSAPQFITQSLDAVGDFVEDVTRLRDALARAGLASDLRTQLSQVVTDVGALPFAGPDGLGAAIASVRTLLDAVDSALAAYRATIDALVLPEGSRRELRRLLDAVRAPVADVENLLEKFATGYQLARNLTVRLEWRPRLKGDSYGIFQPLGTDPRLLLAVEARAKPVGKKPPGVDLACSLENFQINLIGTSAKFLALKFKRLIFAVESGKKADVDVVFDGMVFDGVLGFVDALRKVIPTNGFSDPPALDVSTAGIASSFSLALPSLAVGVFTLQNLSLGAAFKIPFIGEPLSLNFSFCTREQPFVLTVSALGGGGFFGITVTPKGVQILEAALEFGASIALDFGVASGSVTVMGGIYFRTEEGAAQLTGYVRIRGEVDVLGLVTASLEMRMELSYEFASGKVVGRATIEIEVSVAFFSKTVAISAERKFAGSNDDPTFLDTMSPYALPDGSTARPFDEYLAAFVLAA